MMLPKMVRQIKVARDTAVKAKNAAIIVLKTRIVDAPGELREALEPRGLRHRSRPAAEMMIVAGDNPTRLRSKAAFAKLCGACPTSTAMSDHHLPVAANVLDREFTAAAPNQRWVGDTTEFAIRDSGKLMCPIQRTLLFTPRPRRN